VPSTLVPLAWAAAAWVVPESGLVVSRADTAALVLQTGFLSFLVYLPSLRRIRTHAAACMDCLQPCDCQFRPGSAACCCLGRWHAVGDAGCSMHAIPRAPFACSDMQDSASGCRASQGCHGVLFGQRCMFPPQSHLVCCLTPPVAIASISAGRSASRC
jgi:hypothetical protein